MSVKHAFFITWSLVVRAYLSDNTTSPSPMTPLTAYNTTDNSSVQYVGQHQATVQIHAHVLGILPYDRSFGFGLPEVSVAMNLAEENLAKRNLLIKNVKFHFWFNDSKCNFKNAAMAFIQRYFAKQVNVVIGPLCDYSLAPVSRYAPYWNIPVLSPGGISHTFKEERSVNFMTLTRVGGTLDPMIKLFLTFMKRSNWTKFTSVYDTDVDFKLCYLRANAITSYVKANPELQLTVKGIIVKGNSFNITDILTKQIGTQNSGEYSRGPII